MLAIEPVR